MESSDQPPAKVIRRSRLGPIVEAMLFTVAVAIAISISLNVIDKLSREAMEGEIKAGLERQVSVVARMLDGELGDQHHQFTPEKLARDPAPVPPPVPGAAKETEATRVAEVYKRWDTRLKQDAELKSWRDPMLANPVFTNWAGRMERVRLAAKDTRYAYTNVNIDGKIYFGANLTLQDDSDGDGKPDDPPTLLCPYPDHDLAIAKALATKTTQVTNLPYTDIWGTYFGGYAPFYDSAGNVVGTIGMDLELSSYNARLAPITRAVKLSRIVGLGLAIFCGILVYISRIRIARVTYQLEVDRLLLAEANSEIQGLNAKLKGENLRMSAELEVTRRLQMLTLPKTEELDNADAQLDIAAYAKPADEVGGDYYDVLKDTDRVRIGIGDVTGHGLESGMVMLMAQTAMRTVIDMGVTDLTKVLPAVNRTLYHQIARMGCDRNMTLAMVEYHQGQVTVCGQHEELIVIRADGGFERIDTGDLGFYVGMVEHIDDMVATAELHLQPGDILVLYSDGIPEAADTNNALYGLDRLCEVVRDARGQSAHEIKDLVIKDVERHMGTQKMFDDITLVVCKRIPTE